MPTSSKILAAYLDSRVGALSVRALYLKNQELFGTDFLPVLNYYLSILTEADGALIAYEHLIDHMSEAEKSELLWKLKITKMLLSAQAIYEDQHRQVENLKKYDDYRKQCKTLILRLDKTYKEDELEDLEKIVSVDEGNILQLQCFCMENLPFIRKQLQVAYHIYLYQPGQTEKRAKCARLIDHLNRQARNEFPEQSWFVDSKPVKYLGLALAQLRIKGREGLIKLLSKGNDTRLYWVWGGGVVKFILDKSLAPDFFNYNAKNVAHFPDFYTGCMSWGLYFFRFGLYSSEFYENLAHPSPDDKNQPWQARTNSRRKKFPILNDFLWGLFANFPSFFWLNDRKMGSEGYPNQVIVADVLTTLLLIFDTTMAIIEYKEEEAIYLEEIRTFDDEIGELSLIDETRAYSPEKRTEYARRLAHLIKERELCQKNWHLQRLTLVINITYATGLFLSFAMVAFAGSSLPLALIGTVCCFALTCLNNALKDGMEIYKLNLSLKEKTATLKTKCGVFRQLSESKLDEAEASNLDAKKLLFLEIKGLVAETDYQKASINLQTMQFIRGLLLEGFIIPAMIFLPLGLNVYPAIFAIACLSNLMVTELMKTEKVPLKQLDEKEFNKFDGNLDTLPKNPAPASLSFFPKWQAGKTKAPSLLESFLSLRIY